MALFYDQTKAASSKQLSGLVRVSKKLRHALEKQLGEDLIPVVWHQRKRRFYKLDSRQGVTLSPDDHFLTTEIFSSDNRLGLYEALTESGVNSAAVFHDAIPYKHPKITWPRSVARHPQYMCDLAELTHVFSVSGASQADLENYWSGSGISKRPGLSTITLGANFFDRAKVGWVHAPDENPVIVNVGILEPRKNQSELLEVACRLWDAGHRFELHFVGRVNPHFGKPVARQIKRAKKSGYQVHLHTKQSDATLRELYSRTHFTVFNSIAEGFGLPVIESLWLGIPCLMRRLSSLDSFVDGRSLVAVNSAEDLETKMEDWLANPEQLEDVRALATTRTLPTWDDAVGPILAWKNNG